LPLQPKRAIAGLTRGVHGGFDHAEMKALGIDIEDVLDFSVCTNPFMPPPGIKEAISSAPIERYPDSQSSLLRQKLAEKLGIDENNILVGSGTTELIRLVVQVYFQQKDRVLILEPTYGEYEVACRLGDTHLIKYRAVVKDKFRHRVEGVTATIRQKRPRGIFICNPNNPTGQYLSHNDIEKVTEAMKGGLVIIDEAYISFVAKRWNSLDLIQHVNVVILRSMTKDYGLPGLRLGYAVASLEIIDSLRTALPPWNVNAVAQQAGITVLENEEYLQESLRKTREASEFLLKEISRLGLKTLSSDAHYFLVKVGNATECRRSLLMKGILVRDCSSFGLPEYIRISPRTIPECRKLVSALRVIVQKGKGHFYHG
jgi:histidinol-phosphate aminotransferase